MLLTSGLPDLTWRPDRLSAMWLCTMRSTSIIVAAALSKVTRNKQEGACSLEVDTVNGRNQTEATDCSKGKFGHGDGQRKPDMAFVPCNSTSA